MKHKSKAFEQQGKPNIAKRQRQITKIMSWSRATATSLAILCLWIPPWIEGFATRPHQILRKTTKAHIESPWDQKQSSSLIVMPVTSSHHDVEGPKKDKTISEFQDPHIISRRAFVGTVATACVVFGFRPNLDTPPPAEAVTTENNNNDDDETTFELIVQATFPKGFQLEETFGPKPTLYLSAKPVVPYNDQIPQDLIFDNTDERVPAVLKWQQIIPTTDSSDSGSSSARKTMDLVLTKEHVTPEAKSQLNPEWWQGLPLIVNAHVSREGQNSNDDDDDEIQGLDDLIGCK